MSSLDWIKRVVVDVSEADEFEKAVLEWEPFAALVATRDRINDAECTCLCGNERMCVWLTLCFVNLRCIISS